MSTATTDEVLHRFVRQLTQEELDEIRSGRLRHSLVTPVTRDAAPVPVGALTSLLTTFVAEETKAYGARNRPKSDAWLAPRVHASLRLTRVEASDPEMWSYLANWMFPEYVAWRWGGGSVSDVHGQRWRGPVHKQAFARLWWSAELFRNGDDYSQVTRLLQNQDFPNSYVHRVFARSRPLALGLVDALVDATGDAEPTSDQINDVARRVNLSLAASSIESATGYHRDDVGAYRAWVSEEERVDLSWAEEPVGPADGGVSDASRHRAMEIGTRICHSAGLGLD